MREAAKICGMKDCAINSSAVFLENESFLSPSLFDMVAGELWEVQCRVSVKCVNPSGQSYSYLHSS